MTLRLLDLFAGAGGASVGYARAGFDVTGVDHLAHPDYPFRLIEADALDVLADRDFLAGFDAIAASPPCPRYSTITPASSRDGHPDLIPVVRDALVAWGGLYCIENVEGARSVLNSPVRLCGSSFGLPVRRHRLFESNVFFWAIPCLHDGAPVGVYGDHPEPSGGPRRPDGTSRGVKARSVAEARAALGIDWMTSWDDLTDAIPPAYTQFLGEQLRVHAGLRSDEFSAAG